MTDYRLGYKTEARYWLGLSKAAIKRVQAEDGEAAALEPDEIKRLDVTLTELNNQVFGLAPNEGAEELGDKCEWTSDCDSGFACEYGVCVQAEAPKSGAEAPKSGAETPAQAPSGSSTAPAP
jgi:hypothetical protein